MVMPSSDAILSGQGRTVKPCFAASRRAALLACGVIMLAAFAAYRNSFEGPFILDHTPAIQENPTIRQLWPLGRVLSPPYADGITVGGPPMLDLSFAINYAFGGTAVRGYHVLNLAGARPRRPGPASGWCGGPAAAGGRRGSAPTALPLALGAALIWTLHPLQTVSVTYLSQRAESLMGLWYLLTLYGFIRGVEPGSWRGWHPLAVAACLLGMATKEVMVTRAAGGAAV